MVPKLHKKGRSFRGAALYVLHDKDRAKTSDRVAWTDTRNLAVEDPQIAWKLMAATAMDADRLKEAAGVSKAGRKSKDSVLHFTLSWHPDEADRLSPDEMKRAAYAAIRALNGDDRQALIVGHDDEEQPHCHVVLNRVCPETGRMLSSSKEKLNLSRWAQKYEEERGQIYCEERVLNNAARDRGQYVRGEKDTPRHVFEQEASNDNGRGQDAERRTDELKRQQREKDRAVGKEQRATRERQAAAWKQLVADHKARQADERQRAKRNVEQAKERVRDGFKDRWRERYHERQAELRAFEREEETFMGRMRNRAKSIDFKVIFGGGGDKRQAIGDAFGAFASAGARLEQAKREQDRRDAQLKSQQENEARQAASAARQRAAAELTKQRTRFQVERAELMMRQAMEQARVRAMWRQRDRERRTAWEEHRRQVQKNLDAKRAAEQVRRNEQENQRREQRRVAQQRREEGERKQAEDRRQTPSNAPAAQPTRASELLPKEGADQKARQIDQFKEQTLRRMQERRQRPDHDRDDR